MPPNCALVTGMDSLPFETLAHTAATTSRATGGPFPSFARTRRSVSQAQTRFDGGVVEVSAIRARRAVTTLGRLRLDQDVEAYAPRSRSREIRDPRFGTLTYRPDESREDEAVEGQEGVPVQVPEETVRVEERSLLDPSAIYVGKDLELQPRSSRELHLGPQANQMRWLERLDPPEVYGLADTELARVAATPPHAHPAEHPVDEPPKLPQSVAGGPSGITAERAHDVEHRFGGCRTTGPMALEQHALVHRKLAAPGLVPAETGQTGGPRRLDLVARHPGQRQLHRGAVAHRSHTELADSAVISHHNVGVQARHQRLHDRVWNRRDEVDEPAAPFGVRYGEGQNHAAEPANVRVFDHHLPIAQHVRAADLVDAFGIRMVERLGQVLEDVADTDRLAASVHPPRCDHDRQTLGQVPDHFEARPTRNRR